MCGIYGYRGSQESNVAEALLQGLYRLEYRGYDSAGILVADETASKLYRAVGMVSNLSKIVHDDSGLDGDFRPTYGIAHTRWATHGEPSEANCHPQLSNNGKIAVVHNGIIENYSVLKDDLIHNGYIFDEDQKTDTIVIANLIQRERNGDFIKTLEKVSQQIRGAYAILVTHQDYPNYIAAMRLGSPLMVGMPSTETHTLDTTHQPSQALNKDIYFSSDIGAFPQHIKQFLTLKEGDILVADPDSYAIVSGGKPAIRPLEELDQEQLAHDKGPHKHRMIKEIKEQPAIVKRCFKGRVNFDDYSLTADSFNHLKHKPINEIVMVGCGTSYHSMLLAERRMDENVRMRTSTHYASEYEWNTIPTGDHMLHLFTSQSGETADSLACLDRVQALGGEAYGVVNVPGSSIASKTNSGLFTRCGQEISVASTKAFTAQTICLYLLHLYLARKGQTLSEQQIRQRIDHLRAIPTLIESIIDQSELIRSIATQVAEFDDAYFLGRGYQLPIAQEAALKLKEISYIHADYSPAGELKHGSLALIDENFLSVLLMPHDVRYAQNQNTLEEIKARHGRILAISDRPVDKADRQITTPSTLPELSPLLTNVACQLLAYHTADILGRPLDKPRNLAKSVTVK